MNERTSWSKARTKTLQEHQFQQSEGYCDAEGFTKNIYVVKAGILLLLSFANSQTSKHRICEYFLTKIFAFIRHKNTFSSFIRHSNSCLFGFFKNCFLVSHILFFLLLADCKTILQGLNQNAHHCRKSVLSFANIFGIVFTFFWSELIKCFIDYFCQLGQKIKLKIKLSCCMPIWFIKSSHVL